MHTSLIHPALTKGLILLGLVVAWSGGARAQDDGVQAGDSSATAWQRYDWLKPAEDQQRQAASGESFKATAGQNVSDPFAVLSTGSLWQEQYGTLYTRQLDNALMLSCQTTTVTMDDYSDDLSRGEKMGLQFQPVPELTLNGNLHETASDEPLLTSSTTTSGAGLSAEGHLPFNSY